jgi:hypothetical protein
MRRCSMTHTGRMLHSCEAEHRSSSMGCVTQCRSNVASSDALMTTRTEIASGAAASEYPPRAPRVLSTMPARRSRSRICST